jgi:SAM-dependent methyltransferase
MSRIRGINAVWDVIDNGQNPVRIVDIGCGGKKQVPGAIGVDSLPFDGVDIVTDLEKGLPFNDQEVDHIFAIHVLEHLHDLLGVMNEIHRVLRPSGVLHVLVPYASSVNAVADPTHVRFFNQQTFKYFCRLNPRCRTFRPLIIAHDNDTVYADLSPAAAEQPPGEDELARFFD